MSETESPVGDGEIETIQSNDGTEIAVERSGEGTPLLLVHGMSQDRRFWDIQGVRQALSTEHTVYAMDRRGYGESGYPDAFTIDKEIEDIGAVIDWIGEPVHLVGHSYGGMLALEAACRYDIRSLGLFEPAIELDLDSIDMDAVVGEITTLLASDQREALSTFYQSLDSITPEEMDLVTAADPFAEWATTLEDVVFPRFPAMAEYELDLSAVGDITAPTLLLHGSETHQRFENALDLAEDTIGDCQRVELNGGGHLGNLSKPDSFTSAVLDFTSTVE